jgi:hypothetical protein
LHVGAVQFGRFEVPHTPATFAPLSINLRLLPSYASILRALAFDLEPLLTMAGITHLLTMPAATALGVLVSDLSALTLVYPLEGHIEGAYDFNVPTVLLTDVLTDGSAELALIRQARRDGLDIEAIVAVVDFGRAIPSLPPVRRQWITIHELLDMSLAAERLTPPMLAAIRTWLER